MPENFLYVLILLVITKKGICKLQNSGANVEIN